MIDLEAIQKRNDNRVSCGPDLVRQIQAVAYAVFPMWQAVIGDIDALLAEIKRLHAADEIRARDISRLIEERDDALRKLEERNHDFEDAMENA